MRLFRIKQAVAGLASMVGLGVSPSVIATQAPIYLSCERIPNTKTIATLTFEASGEGRATGSYHAADLYHMHVLFIGTKPSNQLVDKVLRNCLAVAAEQDVHHYIIASASHRPHEDDAPQADTRLHPYQKLEMLIYNPERKTIGIRPID